MLIVGAGAAGLSLAVRLSAPGPRATRPPSVMVLEACDGPLRVPDRRGASGSRDRVNTTPC
ncbi:NAD(P)-binding protein [Streptomyces sp. ISL-94]|uniref:NAD(P)-binding protein n=1 Tax=Streptomyces sp. ISL-94 TaxID=2819190 RepID=UPI0035B3A748